MLVDVVDKSWIEVRSKFAQPPPGPQQAHRNQQITLKSIYLFDKSLYPFANYMSNDPEDTNNTNLSSEGSKESTLGVLQSLFAQDEGVDQEQEQVKEWEQPTGDDLRSRLAIITNDIQ